MEPGSPGPPKSSAGRRTLSLPEVLSETLVAHLRRRGLTAAQPDALVFVAPHGGPVRYDKWRRRVWLPACTASGVEGLGFHDLRRVNATVLVAEGVNIKTAQARLGHSDPRLNLAIYAQATGGGRSQRREGARRPPDAAAGRRHPFPSARKTRARPPQRTCRPSQKPPLTWSGRGDSNPRPQRPESGCAGYRRP
ncbi:MAG: hypothetical protein NVS3B21_32760 [Acidimicrobiales bacterium]